MILNWSFRLTAPVSIIVLISLLTVATSSCNSRETAASPSVDSCFAFQDTLIKWEQYVESTADGPWQSQTEHIVSLDRIRVFGGEECLDPPFYIPQFIDICNDTIVVIDTATESVVCIDTTGAVLWRFGGLGEGPGYFMGIGSVSIGDSLIAVVNSGHSTVDLLSRDGQLDRILSCVNNPQNALFLRDGRLVIFSKLSPGGDAHIVDIGADSVLCSFGDGQWSQLYALNSSIYDIYAAEFPPHHIAYLSQYECKLVICDLRDYSHIVVPTRALPFAVTPPEVVVEGNSRYGTHYPLYGALFEGPEGEICVCLHTIKRDGTMIGSGTETEQRAPVTPVDRYSLTGEYLDSFILPDSIIMRTRYSDQIGLIASVQYNEGKVILYRVDQ